MIDSLVQFLLEEIAMDGDAGQSQLCVQST